MPQRRRRSDGGLGRATALQRGQGVVRIFDLASGNVIQALGGIVNLQQVDEFALQLVVVVQSPGVNDGDITLAILGADLFSTGLDLLNQVGLTKSCAARLRKTTG